MHLVPRRGTNREVNRPNQVAGNAKEQNRIGQAANSRPQTAAAQINKLHVVRIAQRNNDRKTCTQGKGTCFKGGDFQSQNQFSNG